MRIRSLLCGVLFAVCTTAFGQTTAATGGGASAAIRQVPDYLDHARRSTVSLGQLVNDGGKDGFSTFCSGVLITQDGRRAVLITAKHCVFDPSSGSRPTQMQVRIPQGDTASSSGAGITFPLVKDGKNLWMSLPDGSDLAAVPIPAGIPNGTHAIPLSLFGGDESLYQGGQVVVLGYPATFGNYYLTTPLARSGIVAWTDPAKGIEGRFLIDANIMHGNSGGPVFHTNSGLTRQGGITLNGSAPFIGIVVANGSESTAVQLKGVAQTAIDTATGEISPYYVTLQNIGGLGVVEPATKVRELALKYFAQ